MTNMIDTISILILLLSLRYFLQNFSLQYMRVWAGSFSFVSLHKNKKVQSESNTLTPPKADWGDHKTIILCLMFLMCPACQEDN